MNKKIRDLLGEITSLSYVISLVTDTDVFMEYSPHVQNVIVRVFKGKWIKDKFPTSKLEAWMMRDDEQDFINQLEDIVNELKSYI